LSAPERPLAFSPDIRFRRVGDEGVVVDQSVPVVMVVNEVGVRALELVREGATQAEVVARIAEEYAVAPETVVADLREYLSDLRGRGILAPEAGE
jgi:hypothetical protein